MTILKTKKVGDEITFHVTKCEIVEGTYGEDVKFTLPNGDTIFISRKTADRQLGRCGFATEEGDAILYGDVDGTTLRLYRTANDKQPDKPYINIDRVTPEDVSKRPSLTAAAKAEAERVRVAKGLPVEEGSLGPDIPGLDDSAYLDSLVADPTEEKISPLHAGLPATTVDKRQAIIEAYRQAWVAAMDVQGPDSTAEALNAGAATIIIQWVKAGLI